MSLSAAFTDAVCVIAAVARFAVAATDATGIVEA